MVDSCTIRSVSESLDETTGAITATYTTLYAGRCKVQTAESIPARAEVGGATLTVQRLRVDVPVGSFAPAVGLQVLVTAATFDPHLAGRVFVVTGLLHKSMATAYRLMVEEVS